MLFRSSFSSTLLPLLLLRGTLAQSGPGVYSLDAIPTAACDGKAGQGSATYSTAYPLDTSVKQLNIYSDGDKGYAKQGGAQWKIWSDTATFSFIGVPGAGAGFGGSQDPATNLEKLLSINADKHSTNFNVTADGLFDHQILVSVAPPGAATKRRSPKMKARADAGYTVTMTATWPCSSMPGIPKSLTVNPAPSDVATACLSNQISDSPDAWKAYGVDAYLTSIIAQETNKPDHPNLGIGGLPGGPIKSSDLDIGSTLTNDAAGPNKCSVSDLCELTKCALIRGDGPIDKSDPARALAFNGYATLSNMLYEFWRAIKFANIEELNNQDQFVKLFYTGTPPAVTWKMIIGEVNPFLAILATIAGLAAKLANVGAVLWIVSSISSEISAHDTANNQAPVLEEKWEKSADLGTAIQGYVQSMTSSVENVHKDLIDNVYGPTFLNFSSGGALLGTFKNDSATYASTIIDNTSALFYMKAIDWVLKQNNVFIQWVPFGAKFTIYDGYSGKRPKPVVKNFDNFSQKDCTDNFQGGDNGTVFTICDAGNDQQGMARIYQITSKVKSNSYTSAVQGWDSAFEIPGGWKFNLPDVMRGAVNSWQAGGFNYNLDTANDSTLAGMLAEFDSSPKRAGIWTTPVCSAASRFDTNPPTGYQTDGNYLDAFLDTTKSNSNIGARGFFDCWRGMQYRNSTTGARPDWFGPEFAESGLPDDLKKAVSP